MSLGPKAFGDYSSTARTGSPRCQPDRWDADAFYDPDPPAPGRMTTRWGGFLPDAARVRRRLFRHHSARSRGDGPAAADVLEVAWEALEHAGIPADSLGGTRTGVMMGLSTWDYTIVNIEHKAEIDAYMSTGNPHSTAVGRISYLLGLRGPAVAVDTACSSSLVAVHLALPEPAPAGKRRGAGRRGTAESVAVHQYRAVQVVGSVARQVGARPLTREPTGLCAARAAGWWCSSGSADAVRDGDRVLAVVRGSAVNQDGRSNGMTAPNAAAQRDVITDALRAGGCRGGQRELRRDPRHRNGSGRSDRVRGAGGHLRPRRGPLRAGVR